jgi:hypothetical protein
MTFWPLITGFIGGVMAWFLTTTIAQPFQRFLVLRQEAALALVDFEDRGWIKNPDAKPPSEKWLEARLNAYDKAGTNLVAFAISNSFITRLLYHPILGRYRCYIRASGENLRVLAATYPGTQISATYQDIVVKELRIVTGPVMPERGKLGKAILILGVLAWAVTGGIAFNAVSQGYYTREPTAILRALAALPPMAIIFLIVGMVVLTMVATILGATRANIAHIWRGFRHRWKGLLGFTLLVSTVVAIATRSSTWWR